MIAALLVSACNLLTPYRAEVQQGNVVTQDMIAKLQPGMTRSQVRFALGTPLMVDPFRQDRWDYVYMLMKQGEVKERRRVVVVFKDDKLVGLEGDVTSLWKDRIERGRDAEKPTAAPTATAGKPATDPTVEKPVAAPATEKPAAASGVDQPAAAPAATPEQKM